MFKRDIEKELIYLATQYPVITIIGPRQAGKTTLSRLIFPDYHYCNLELPELRQLAETDPKAFFYSYPPPIILDEIQRVPSLLSYIQVMVDESDKKGQFILTGSHQSKFHESVTQSLAGRTALLTLLPLTIHELSQSGLKFSREDYLLNGFLPRIYKDKLEPSRTYRNYFQTYVERDLRQISIIRSLNDFEKFVYMLAGRIGQLLNLQSISNNLGVTSKTLKEWISILEASSIIYLLKPYFENLGKRMVKSPKLYFTDVGLATYLLGITEIGQLQRDPLIGNLFENLVVIEALKTRMNLGMDANLFFYRDNNQNEVDLLYKKGREIIPIEIKSAMTYSDSLHKNIDFFQKIAGSNKGFLIYSGDMEIKKDTLSILNFIHTHQVFE
jgi:predicted AAA+ superfamily ATPase